MEKTNHIVILGPGRCGTTVFVRLLHNLGYDTGFSDEEVNKYLGPGGNGLEWPIRGERSCYPMPYVIKGPALSLDLPNRIKRWNWHIDHAYILVRNIEEIINSRFRRTRGTNNVPEEDREEFKKLVFQKTGAALLNCVSLEIPHTILEYPKWIKNPIYCHSNLHVNFTYKNFLEAYHKSIDLKGTS